MVRVVLLVLIAICSVNSFGQESVKASADLILTGGKIATVDSKNSEVEALAIIGDKIIAVGMNAEIEKLRGPTTKTIELKGRRVTPGFIESHGHLTGMGEAMLRVDLSMTKSWEEIVA